MVEDLRVLTLRVGRTRLNNSVDVLSVLDLTRDAEACSVNEPDAGRVMSSVSMRRFVFRVAYWLFGKGPFQAR